MKKWGDVFSGTGTVLLSLLSCAACPMCLPIYAGLLSVIGFELAEIHHIFFPVMLAFAIITLGLMAYQIRSHHGKWAPFQIAIFSAIGMVVASYLGLEYLLYCFLALFMGSVIWNKRTLVHKEHGCC
jgi:hypothetical protein